MIRNVLFLTIDYDLGEYHPGVLDIMKTKDNIAWTEEKYKN